MVRRFFAIAVLAVIALSFGCGGSVSLNQVSTSETFTEDFNPPFLDVLWVVDNRSPMYRTRDHLVEQAKELFTNLDKVPKDYQMAITTADMQIHPGTVYPSGDPLKKNVGTLEDRLAIFGNLISTVINLQTSATDSGFAVAYTTLKAQNFKTRDGVPLVLIFISDSDDHSTDSFGSNPAEDYYQQFLSIKGGNANLLRIYSVNYEALARGDTLATTTHRCATRYSADIDGSSFQNDYFALALLSDSGANATGDLCGSFADQIDFSGLRLKDPVTSFHLQGRPLDGTLSVSVLTTTGTVDVPWSFDAASNSLVFSQPPPEGSIIQVTYTPS